MRTRRLLLLPAALWAAAASMPASLAADAVGGFAVVNRISGPDGRWDYTTIDTAARRLYLGRKAGVLVMDLDTHAITALAVPGENVHGVTVLGDSGLAATTNGDSNSVTIFETRDYKVRGRVKVGVSPDAAIYDPRTRLLAVMNHRDGTVSIVDAATLKLVRTVQVGGTLEAASPTGDGRFFVNVEDRHELVEVDVAAGQVLHRYVLQGCEGPSGLAYDPAEGLVASVCDNGVTKILRAADGSEVATLQTGQGSDGLVYDERRKLFFVPAGRDATLAVIAVDGHKPPVLQQLVPTAPGARLGALDEKTGQLYLPSARRGPPVPPETWPSVVPGTFAFVVVAQR